MPPPSHEILEEWSFGNLSVVISKKTADRDDLLSIKVTDKISNREFDAKWCWYAPSALVVRTNIPGVPEWDGTRLNGERLLVCVDQGPGDAIQHARYLPVARARGAQIILECPTPLLRLFDGFPDCTALIKKGAPRPAFDLYCHIDYFHILFHGRPDQPAASPYLKPPAIPTMRLPKRKSKPFRVGINWAGNPKHANDRFRSVDLSCFEPLLGVHGVEWFSLQIGERTEELALLGWQDRITPVGASIHDFADLASVMTQLDLIITIDSAPAHLAGAIGRPVWVMLPKAPDWRWLLARPDTPLYPTMRLFRQATLGDWGSVVNDIKAALNRWLSTGYLK